MKASIETETPKKQKEILDWKVQVKWKKKKSLEAFKGRLEQRGERISDLERTMEIIKAEE